MLSWSVCVSAAAIDTPADVAVNRSAPASLASVPSPIKSVPNVGVRCDAAATDQARIRLSISGMRSKKGAITISIYPDLPKHFLDGRYRVARLTLPVSLPVTQACFALSAPGKYAVALFQDANENGHFDTNWLGIPVEGYGFSRNPTLYFGPPDLKQVLIAVHTGDNSVAIKMKYY